VDVAVQQNENGFFKFVWRIAGAAATCILLGLFAGLSNLQLEDATTPDGTNYRKLIEGVDQLYSVKQIADDKVLVLYQMN